MTKRRCNPSEAHTPLGRWIWTEKETGEEFTTETAQQNDGTFLCFVVESPDIRATADAPEEATREVLRQIKERTNPEMDSGESEEEILVACRSVTFTTGVTSL
jgi:hypothetical protein